jgi:putative nucleotidyltransferase with HDIG domain
MMCKLVSERDPGISSEEAHIAGLLHDIGKVIMDFIMPVKFQKTMRQVREGGVSTIEAEKEFIGLSHDEVGALAAERWRFPEFLQEAIAYHHKPQEVLFNDIVQLVAMADKIIHAFREQEKKGEDYRLPELDDSWRSRWLPTPRHDELIITKYEVEIDKVRDIQSLYS